MKNKGGSGYAKQGDVSLESLAGERFVLWDTRGLGKRLKNGTYRRYINKNSFPPKSMDACNTLEKKAIQRDSEFKSKLDKNKYGDWPV